MAGTTVGLLIYLYLLNQLILFGAALAATATKGTAIDLGAGVAGLGAGGVLTRHPHGREVRSRVPTRGTPVDNVGEPHGSGPEKPR